MFLSFVSFFASLLFRVRPDKACMLTVSKAHDADVNVINWNANEPFIASGGDEGHLKIWDLRTLDKGQVMRMKIRFYKIVFGRHAWWSACLTYTSMISVQIKQKFCLNKWCIKNPRIDSKQKDFVLFFGKVHWNLLWTSSDETGYSWVPYIFVKVTFSTTILVTIIGQTSSIIQVTGVNLSI